MATNFPTSLDSFVNPTPTSDTQVVSHSSQHANANDAIAALEAKVGANSSAVTTSHDYKLSGVTGTDKAASKTGTETLTNKTLTSPVINVGSDATGDMYYRNAGVLTRLPIGSTGQILTVAGGVPTYASPSTANTNYIADTGAVNALVATLSPALAAYAAGVLVQVKVANTNTGATTINVNSLGAKTIKKGGGATDLVAGDIVAGQVISLEYDGTNFQLQSPSALALNSNGSGANLTNLPNSVTYKNGTTTRDASLASSTQTIAHGLGVAPKYVRITALINTVNTNGTGIQFNQSLAVYNGTTQSSMSVQAQSTTTSAVTTTFILSSGTLVSDYQTGVITVDATNINIAWTKTGAPSGTWTLLWEAQG